ncbi:solute carrier family 25 member 53-like [Conger conger]|nr:solute carrier family 25 member 53-like [Conger conger]XP_061093062.1 solute carrier family 25 member 53-like [Conger conger]
MQRSRGESGGDEQLTSRDLFTCLRSYLHGGTSSMLSTLTTLATFPVYKTVFRQQLHNTLVRETVAQLYKEGPRKLYRGVLPPLLVKTLHGTLLFGLQDTFLHQLSPHSGGSVPVAARQALAGVGTGAVEALVFTPFERVQNLLQNGRNDRSLPTLQSVLLCLRRESLAAGFYRAAVPVLARNTLGNSLYFGLKDPLRDALRERGLSPVASSFTSGMVNAMAISLPLYPLSVLVANMQAQVGAVGGGARQCWAMLWESRQRSVRLLYRGGSLVILRSCLTWGIATAIYDRLERRGG